MQYFFFYKCWNAFFFQAKVLEQEEGMSEDTFDNVSKKMENIESIRKWEPKFIC